MSYEFDVNGTKDKCIKWIREWFQKNGAGCNAVIGISGGKDSTVAAALCVEALGKDRVIGVMMPNGIQKDISDSQKICDFLGIRNHVVNIEGAYNAITSAIEETTEISGQTRINLAPRIRMATLYAFSQSNNGRVVNTCNLSEDYVGYSTKYGDAAGDFSPLCKLTVAEVLRIGDALGLPYELVHKTPSDGLCGKTDEDNLGFTYAALDLYIREGICEDAKTKERIDTLHKKNLFKLLPMEGFDPSL